MLEHGKRFIVIGSHDEGDTKFIQNIQSITQCPSALRAMIGQVYGLATRFVSMVSDGKFNSQSSTEEPDNRKLSGIQYEQQSRSMSSELLPRSDTSIQIIKKQEMSNKNGSLSRKQLKEGANSPDWIRFVALFTRKIANCLRSYQEDILMDQFKKVCKARLLSIGRLKQYVSHHPKLSTQTFCKKTILNVICMLTENPEFLQHIASKAALSSILTMKINVYRLTVQEAINFKKEP